MSKIAILEHLRLCADRSKNYVLELLGDVTGTVADALDEMDMVKANKTSALSVTIPKTGWSSDSNANYPKYYDIAVAGLTTNDRAEITIAPNSMGTAVACGLCPTNETLAGKIRIRSSSVPAAAMAAECWIEDGREKK